MVSYPRGYDAIFVFNRIKPIRCLKKELIIIQYAYNQKEGYCPIKVCKPLFFLSLYLKTIKQLSYIELTWRKT